LYRFAGLPVFRFSGRLVFWAFRFLGVAGSGELQAGLGRWSLCCSLPALALNCRPGFKARLGRVQARKRAGGSEIAGRMGGEVFLDSGGAAGHTDRVACCMNLSFDVSFEIDFEITFDAGCVRRCGPISSRLS
jgi:hypothetical protein